MRPVDWSIKEVADLLRARQSNEFDGNLAVTGDRGNGKSTVISKIFYRFKSFNPWKHQVYNRDAVIKLLKTQVFGLCMDDEAINSSYKREFQNKGQQEFIKILTAYRDNFNIFASALPNFFSLDRDLRDLYFLHLQVIERGIAVVHMPIQGRLYSQDRWDSKYNAKVEESWSKKMMKDPNFKPPYHKLTTFRGYLYFNDLTPKQKELYKEVKKAKRQDSFITEKEKEQAQEKPFINKLYDLLINEKLTKEGIMQSCQIEGKKYSVINASLNRMLKDNGISKTVGDFLHKANQSDFHNKIEDQINSLIPVI